MLSKNALKEALGEIPLTAEAYWSLRQGGGPVDPHFSLDRLEARLPEWQRQVQAARRGNPGSRIMVFATLRYWIEHAALLGLALAGAGHQVTLAFLPYGSWKEPANRFDLRRQNAYAGRVLRLAEPAIQVASLLDRRVNRRQLPADLQAEIEDLAKRDTQYTLQVEEIDRAGDLYRLRLERDSQAALAALSWIETARPEVVIVPNGSILEFGAVYAAARRLGVRVVTYEFGEQDGRVWLAQDGPVMFQETGGLWSARKDVPLTPAQRERVEKMFESRQGARRWENFARRWQGTPSEGARQVRESLGLDSRPVVLMATNVIGDSLTLGRQAFSETMTEWIQRTGDYFSRRDDCQFVVRIHPGEALMKGPSVLEVLDRILSGVPENIRLVPATAPVNTYDLIANADLGLVYTTTAGLEMVMSGVPVIVSGRTHYRNKGFTFDPESWEEYFALLDSFLADPAQARPSPGQVELAWRYAYSFFFEYPRPFPWHLLYYWDKLDEWPLERVLSPEGQEAFGATFRHLAGEPLAWEEILEL
ncbi:MAG TPA: hypothetical protein VJ768_06940 [Anaerolineales bacterium]|nr:hypothetical protein [Anaerolineales bacterium]